MTYRDYLKAERKSVNELPIFFAFNMEQFKEEMEARGLTVDDTDQIYSLGAGGYYLRKDADVIAAFLLKKDGLRKMMRDPAFAEDAFYYEMCNHEYGINLQADWDVCGCFGNPKYRAGADYRDYLKEMRYSKKVVEAYSAARARYFKDAEAWF